MNHWENQLQSLGITQWHNGHVSKRRIQDMQTLESGYRITPFQLRSQNPQSSAPNTICPSPPNGRFQDLFHEDGCLTGGDVAYVACMPWPKNPQTRLGPTRPDSAHGLTLRVWSALLAGHVFIQISSDTKLQDLPQRPDAYAEIP